MRAPVPAKSAIRSVNEAPGSIGRTLLQFYVWACIGAVLIIAAEAHVGAFAGKTAANSVVVMIASEL